MAYPGDRRLSEFGRILQQARAAKYRSVEHAAETGGIAHTTWRRMEHGDRVRPGSYNAIDRAFDLPAGTTRNALFGTPEAFSDLLKHLSSTQAVPINNTGGDRIGASLDVAMLMLSKAFARSASVRGQICQLKKAAREDSGAARQIHDYRGKASDLMEVLEQFRRLLEGMLREDGGNREAERERQP